MAARRSARSARVFLRSARAGLALCDTLRGNHGLSAGCRAHYEEFGAETMRLLVCASGELGAADAIGKTWVILDPGARAGLPSGRVPLAHQRAKSL